MKLTPTQYDEIVLTLENDAAFYKAYTNPANNTYGKRREVINKFLGWSNQPGRIDGPHWWRRQDIEDRDQIRRYFDDRYEIPQIEINSYSHLPSWWEKPKPHDHQVEQVRVLNYEDFEPQLSEPPMAIYNSNPAPTPKEISMNKTAVEITTMTMLNGRDISTIADSEIYSLIAEQEKEIERLQAIKNKPKKLIAEIDKRQTGITALVTYFDSRES